MILKMLPLSSVCPSTLPTAVVASHGAGLVTSLPLSLGAVSPSQRHLLSAARFSALSLTRPRLPLAASGFSGPAVTSPEMATSTLPSPSSSRPGVTFSCSHPSAPRLGMTPPVLLGPQHVSVQCLPQPPLCPLCVLAHRRLPALGARFMTQ